MRGGGRTLEHRCWRVPTVLLAPAALGLQPGLGPVVSEVVVRRIDYRGASAPTRLNMTSLLERHFVDRDRWLYSLLSGSAHVKGWFLEAPPEDADEGVRAIMLPLLQISEVYTRTLCAYFGLTSSPS